jgi:hypothetical protein
MEPEMEVIAARILGSGGDSAPPAGMLTLARQPTRYKAKTSPFFLMLTPY